MDAQALLDTLRSQRNNAMDKVAELSAVIATLQNQIEDQQAALDEFEKSVPRAEVDVKD